MPLPTLSPRTRLARRGAAQRREAGLRPSAVVLAGAALVAAAAWLGLREVTPAPPGTLAEPASLAPRAEAPLASPRPAAPERAEAPVPSPDALVPGLLDDREPWIDEDGRPSRELVRNALETAIADHFPSHKLSEDDVEVLTDAVLRIREARLALAELPETEEVAPLRRALVEEIEDAGRSFAEVMEMGLDAFTAGAGGGVDTFDPREPVPAGELLTETR